MPVFDAKHHRAVTVLRYGDEILIAVQILNRFAALLPWRTARALAYELLRLTDAIADDIDEERKALRSVTEE